MHPPLRYVVPPLFVLLGLLAISILEGRHAKAKRERPHEHPHDSARHTMAASVMAGALIVAFIAAFILP